MKEELSFTYNTHQQYISATVPENYAAIAFAANPYVIRPELTRFEDISDGLSSTFMLGTVCYKMSAWGDPGNFRDPFLGVNLSDRSFGRLHRNIPTLIVMVDGSVRTFTGETDSKNPETWLKLALPNNGIPTEEEF